METYVLVGGRGMLHCHDRADCYGPPCLIHSPSEHHMRGWDQNWRADRRIMERLCEHGIGHPDPDDYKVRMNSWGEGIHGCDGCCFRYTDYPPPAVT
jgi:hypothetical protein